MVFYNNFKIFLMTLTQQNDYDLLGYVGNLSNQTCDYKIMR